MASFTDTQPQQFTPYIPKYNTELYAQIGMSRQNQYDQNLEKVQSYVASIAGLQVSREVDQKYLEQKVGDLRSNLQSIAGADFSRKQVMNSAGGYISRISTDRNIQAAVASTANRQKDLEAIKTATKDGKAAPSNTEDLLMAINAYDTSQDLGATYTEKGYTPYYNGAEAFQKYYKDVKGDIIVEETPSSYNEDGTPNYRAYTLVNNRREYLDPAKVAQDYQSWLQQDQQAQQQLDIDARYYARRVSTEASASQLRANYDENLKDYNSKIADYRRLANGSSGSQKERYEQSIEALTKQRTELGSNLQRGLDLLDRDPQAFKTHVYKQGVMTGVANRYAYNQVEQTLKKNPQMEMEFSAQGLNLRAAELEQRALDNKLDRDLKWAEHNFKVAGTAGGVDGIPLPVTPDKAAASITALQQTLKDDEANITSEQMALVPELERGLPDSEKTVIYDGATGMYRPNANKDWKQAYNRAIEEYEKDPVSASASVKAVMEGGLRQREMSLNHTKQALEREINSWEATLTPEQIEVREEVELLKRGLPQGSVTVELPTRAFSQDKRITVTREMMEDYIQLRATGKKKQFTDRYSEDEWDAAVKVGRDYIRGSDRLFGAEDQSQAFKNVEKRYSRSGLEDKYTDLADRMITFSPNKARVVPYKAGNPILSQVGLLATAQGNQSFGTVSKAAGGQVDVVFQVNPDKNTVTAQYRNTKTNELSDPITLNQDQAIALGQGDMFQEGKYAHIEKALLNNSLPDTPPDVRGTTKGGIVPVQDPYAQLAIKYPTRANYKQEANGTYSILVEWRDRDNETRGWRTLPDNSVFPDIASAEAHIQKIQNMSIEEFQRIYISNAGL